MSKANFVNSNDDLTRWKRRFLILFSWFSFRCYAREIVYLGSEFITTVLKVRFNWLLFNAACVKTARCIHLDTFFWERGCRPLTLLSKSNKLNFHTFYFLQRRDFVEQKEILNTKYQKRLDARRSSTIAKTLICAQSSSTVKTLMCAQK